MKIPMAIAELVAEFSGLNRTPDFKPVTNCAGNSVGAQGSSCSGRTTPTQQSQKYNGDRRHSVVITVGADKLPTVPSEQSPLRKSSNRSIPEMKFRKNRRQSAPCISTIESSTSLKKKLSKLRSANSSGDEQEDDIKEDEEDDEFHYHNNQRKQSVSYRLA